MKDKNGFTLIELLSVIAIIAVLIIIAVPAALKIYNESVIKNMHVQEVQVKDAANLFVEDYCKSTIDQTRICPKSYNNAVNGKKTVCLQDLQNSSEKYIRNVKYKDSDCKGYVTYYLDENTGVYGSEKTYLFCGKDKNDNYAYLTDKDYDIKEYCSCNDDDICEDADKNTYCTFDGEMKQGKEYINGQYVYRYMQQGAYSGSKNNAWSNIYTDGWGVQLANKNSSADVISKPCTYINGKPVVSMSNMFANSNALNIDLSSFSTAKVTNMSHMFYSSSATTIDLSSFNTSKVTNMSYMFSYSKVPALDLSGFDTSKVTNMSYMFEGSAATTLNLSSFDTSKVTDMYGMFNGAKATIGYVKDQTTADKFNDSNVTNIPSTLKFTVK